MKWINYIAAVVALSGSLISNAQESNFENPNEVIEAYFEAISDNKDSSRIAQLNALFTPGGQINATIHQTPYQAQQRLGSVDDFLTNTQTFYDTYSVEYEEVERAIDYYQDLAMINSLVFQVLQKNDQKDVRYEQWLWFSFDLAFSKDRWFINTVSWVNSFETQSIEDAMLQDTLWHHPER